MPDEYLQELDSSEDSTRPTGEENQPELDIDEVEVEQEQIEAQQAEEETPAAVVATPAPAIPTVPPASTTAPPEQVRYTPAQPIGMSEGLKTELAVYLPEEVVSRLDTEMRSIGVTAAQQAVQASYAQETAAKELGVPAEYVDAVRNYLPVVQASGTITDPKQATLAAVQMALYERAVRNGGDLAAEMEKYVQAVRGSKAPASPPEPPKSPRPPAQVRPLHPDAQPTRSAIQGTPVKQPVRSGANSRTATQIEEKMPWLAGEEE